MISFLFKLLLKIALLLITEMYSSFAVSLCGDVCGLSWRQDGIPFLSKCKKYF
jgi:hypothetical protein